MTGTVYTFVESHLSKLNINKYPNPRFESPAGVIGKVCG